MKKILFGLLIALLLTGCILTDCEKPKIKIMHDEEIHQVVKFEFEGHKYISFEIWNTGHTNGVGVVHDPDCSCQKRLIL